MGPREAMSAIISEPSSSGSLVNERDWGGKVPLAMSKTQGHLCLVKKRFSKEHQLNPCWLCIQHIQYGFQSHSASTANKTTGTLAPTSSLGMLVSSVPTVCQSNQSTHLFSPNQVRLSAFPENMLHSALCFSVSLFMFSLTRITVSFLTHLKANQHSELSTLLDKTYSKYADFMAYNWSNCFSDMCVLPEIERWCSHILLCSHIFATAQLFSQPICYF